MDEFGWKTWSQKMADKFLNKQKDNLKGRQEDIAKIKELGRRYNERRKDNETC